jgi:hypothetical protein
VKRVLRWAVGAAVVLMIGIQFIRPERTNPQADEASAYDRYLNVDEDIAHMLRRSCFDCHSNQTVWPWYSQVAPASWLLARDVKNGRRHLNFSAWGTYKITRQLIVLNNIAEEVSSGGMPDPPYLLLHHDAALDSAARKKIADWADREKERLSQLP